MLARPSLRTRAAALLPLATLGVHEGRYRLAYGSDAGAELGHQGHAYLSLARPVVGLLCGGLVGVLGEGGWLVFPLCLAAAGVVTLVLSGARRAALALASRSRVARHRRPRPVIRRAPVTVHLPRRVPLASPAAGRAPPGSPALCA